MEDLLTKGSGKLEVVPPCYCVPLHERIVDSVEIVNTIPIIDLGKDRPLVVQQVLKAFEEYGFFQVINHGVSENLMEEAMKVSNEFFNLSAEEKEKYTKDVGKKSERGEAALYNSSPSYSESEGYRYWRDVLGHNANSDKKDRVTWPDNPPRYREVIGEYTDGVRKLSKVILGLLAEGLGLEAGFFDKEFGQRFSVNRYPASPDPSLTIGAPEHCDPNLITIIQQNVYGLQVLKDDKWIGVEPIPNAFVVNSGLPITVISNGKLASVAHRVVSNATHDRTSLGIFVLPEKTIEPAKSLIGPHNPPKFKSFDWFTEFMPHYSSKRSVYITTLDAFKINA